MPRITPIDYAGADATARAEWDDQLERFGRMTNMKRTLARSGTALAAYMTWYPLRDEVETFLGKRLTVIFAHAVSTENDCLICSTYFRRNLIDAGEDPDALVLDDREALFVRFGRQIARDPHGVSDDLFDEVAARLTPDQILTLVAFAGLMVATNIVNDVLHVDLDGYLEPYRAASP